VTYRAEILHAEFAGELPLDLGDVYCAFAGNENVVNPNRDDYAEVGVDIETGIRIGVSEADFDEKFMELYIPDSRRLF